MFCASKYFFLINPFVFPPCLPPFFDNGARVLLSLSFFSIFHPLLKHSTLDICASERLANPQNEKQIDEQSSSWINRPR